ncbi:MAG: Holliday junction branch migration DNA helicase RuvB [Mycoplasmataceae bacterium]|nr:Holliday junction branch migration DNA helicase RuvB [Mycoplasmataceae bacterium]
MNEIRPKNFNEFIGQENLIEILKVYCDVAIKQNKALKHLLFYGLPGTGKTSLGFLIANELKVKIHFINANNIHNQADLISLFSLIKANDIIFIDELQSIDLKIVELLYPMMEDYFIDIPLGKDFNKKSTRIKIPPFSLIASTTSIGKIQKPLLDRFQLVYKMQNYSEKDLIKILNNIVLLKNQTNLVKDIDLEILSKYCKNNPRIAINLLLQVIDFRLINLQISINEILTKLKIYHYGLTVSDLEYLKVIHENNNSAIGIKTLVQITGYDSYTIENYIEPFLLKINLLIKTSKGRILTKKGIELLNKLENEI